MAYRPDGWKEIHHKEYRNANEAGKIAGLQLNTLIDTFEAGADAMLEGLKGNAWNRIVPGNYVETNADGYKYHEPDSKGYLVFIPEEEIDGY